MYSNRPGIPPVPAYIYTSIHQTPALELHLANTYPSDQSGTCSHLLESSLHPGRYRALPSCRTREAHTRCPFYERERQNRCCHRPTATMDHHSHPVIVIGANPGHSALLDMTPRSSPKVLIAQTPNPLSAANERTLHSFASPSVKYRLASSERWLLGQHQP